MTAVAEARTAVTYDVAAVRAQFPIIASPPGGRALHYLDSAATAQKPRAVLDAMTAFYESANANIHRGAYGLAAAATAAYEDARAEVARFIHAADVREVIFTRGTTSAVNAVAQAWGGANLQAGDEILVTAMEHHANLVPWQIAAQRAGARIVGVGITDAGELDLDDLRAKLSPRTKVLAITSLSNVLGTIVPLDVVIPMAKAVGARVLVDAAQSVAHLPTDVQAIGADWLVFSGHKLGGPTGIGVLWGRLDVLSAMPPFEGGGGMIELVELERSTYAPPPARFEAGTPPIAEAVGLAAALRWIGATGFDRIAAHEARMLAELEAALDAIPGVVRHGQAAHRASVCSFSVGEAHPHDVATILDAEGVAIRAGHHCAQPLMRRLRVPATARASVSPYTDASDIDALVRGVRRVAEIFG
jgi:cysteine desulfurase/selenocysteine lyase